MTEAAYAIRHLPEQERPRERLIAHGPEGLATAELMAVILGSGMRGKSVLALSQELLVRFGGLEGMAEAAVEELMQIPGMGQAKAVQLKAALSLAARLKQGAQPARYQIHSPQHVYHLVKEELEQSPQERFLAILLDAKGGVIRQETISVGTLTEALVHPRDVFRQAIRSCAASLVAVHNHPSGDPTPSQQDIDLTDQLIKAGDLIGIPVQDHLVVGKGRYVSIRELTCWPEVHQSR